ncbi:MAG: mevalonate kinase [Anaerolineae bacterium]|nr:mevalonate kinase [Anaerolineae bacterium]
MRAIASAPGKVILFGEHAVVYGRPAIAVPVAQVRATAEVAPGVPGSGLHLVAADLGRTVLLADAPADEPLAAIARLTLAHLGIETAPDTVVTVRSTIPIASGMGSGAAVSSALTRALAAYCGRTLATEEVSALVFEVDKLYHGTPSGIDNTVIAYEQPVYFVKGEPPQPFHIAHPFTLVIADTGIASPTKVAVGDVRRAWQADTDRYERLFDRIGEIVRRARRAIEHSNDDALGPLLDENHRLLQELGVSSPELDRLAEAARAAGARGAKLSGAGRGGNLIALVRPDQAETVSAALRAAGARGVTVTQVG